MDLRIQKTYRALTGAFTRLLSQNRYENISVAALCDEAMIRRTTFYKHFRDKDDFFVFFINDLRENFLTRGAERADAKTPGHRSPEAERESILRQLASFLLEHKALMDNIFKSSMSGTMTLVICDVVTDALRERYRGRAGSNDPAASEALSRAAEFAAGGIVRLMQLWWQNSVLITSEDAFVQSTSELVGRVMEG